MQTPKVALCITGQMYRLEFESKIRFLQAHPSVDAFVSLQTGRAVYSRSISDMTNKCSTIKINHTQIDALRPVHTTLLHNKNFMLPDVMKHRIDSKKYRTFHLFPLHVYQYQNWRQCSLDIQAHELHRSFFYDYVIRVRDNTIITNSTNLMKTLSKNYCTTKGCNSYGGYHDKVMSCPRRFLQPMLRDISERFLLSSAHYERDMNTETTLKRTLDELGVPVRTLNWYPSHDARPCNCNKSHLIKWCPVKTVKDCTPSVIPL
jgi:hypothetical protein